MWVERYAFRESVVEGVDIFKWPADGNLPRNSPTFVSQAFVDLWQSAGLTGLTFTELWPDSKFSLPWS